MKTIKETDKKLYKDEDLAAYINQLNKEKEEQKLIANNIQHTFLKRIFYLLHEHGKI